LGYKALDPNIFAVNKASGGWGQFERLPRKIPTTFVSVVLFVL